MDIVVSIIIPTFNASRTLGAALESVMNQTFQQWECIVIDGASKDNTLEVVQQYIDNDSRFSVISEPDNGIYDAMNKGWKIASGEWIHYLGADDELLSNGIKDLIENSYNQDVVYGNTYLRFSNGKYKPQYSKEIIYIKKTMVTCHQSLIMKKDIIKELNGFNLKYKIIADFDLILRCYICGYRFRKSDAFISVFSLNGTSESNINRLILERHIITRNNRSVRFPVVYTTYFFVKQNIAKIKHNTIDRLKI